MIAVDVAHWHGTVGGVIAWIYRNCAGNVAASAIWGPIGLIVGAAWERSKVIRPIHHRLDRHEESLRGLHTKQDRLHKHLGVTA